MQDQVHEHRFPLQFEMRWDCSSEFQLQLQQAVGLL